MPIITKEEEQEILNLLSKFELKDLESENYEKRFNCLRQQGFSLAEGASKGVIIPKDKDYVIKLPFFGRTYHYNNDTEQAYDNFYSNISGSSDYCEAEVMIYERAKEEGLEFCFAETYCIGEVNHYPVYIQQKALIGIVDWDTFCEENGGEEKATVLYDSLSKEYSITDEEYGKLDPIWINDFISAYDADVFDDLASFLLDNEVSDLHDENVGYIAGLPVLVDYSSFDG